MIKSTRAAPAQERFIRRGEFPPISLRSVWTIRCRVRSLRHRSSPGCAYILTFRDLRSIRRSSDVSGHSFRHSQTLLYIMYVPNLYIYIYKRVGVTLYGELQRRGGGQSRFERAKWRDQRGEQTSLTVYIVGIPTIPIDVYIYVWARLKYF